MSTQMSGKLLSKQKQLKNNPENKKRLAQEKLFILFLISWRAFWIFYEYSTFTQFPLELDVCFKKIPQNLWIFDNFAPNVASDRPKTQIKHVPSLKFWSDLLLTIELLSNIV